ncbi:MAG: class I SAM-dependent methyltransferase [Alphaproteobacteria bacterium]|nr:class I SAM-dependent methyltransferase [Alphaproteobacteria bacterium]
MAQRGLTRWMQFALMLGARARRGSMTVEMPDGRRFLMRGEAEGPDAVMLVLRQDWARRLLTGGNLSFAESFLDGDFDSPNLAAVTEWAVANEELDEALMGKAWFRIARRVLFALQANTRRGSRRNISYHYDLGNDFYRLWLDPSMTYSSAIFTDQAQELEAAQMEKYRRLARIAGIRQGDSVLEIGSGWGGFACLAAREFGARVTTLTISRAQYELASARIAEAGLADRVEVRLQDYREVRGEFDCIASIEMFEAVGERYWPIFFQTIRDRLKPEGRAALQVITIADRYFEAYRGTMDFIQRYIFPGGMLPSPAELTRQATGAGLRESDIGEYGADYARTLAEWTRRFRAAWPQIEAQGFDERFRRMWEYYLAYCEGGFRAGVINVRQFALSRA